MSSNAPRPEFPPGREGCSFLRVWHLRSAIPAGKVFPLRRVFRDNERIGAAQ
jgi:hypothetical protein